MATLQKFKLLATQCAVLGSPTRSPTTSPVIHLRRRKTLRMLLSRTVAGSSSGRRPSRSEESTDRQGTAAAAVAGSPEKSKELAISHKLRDLFVSSPPLEQRPTEKVRNAGDECFPETSVAGCGGGLAGRRVGQRSLRPLSAAFRQRLLRRAWRPMLVTIPE